MKIPLFQSKLLASNEAPGQAFQTRKNAQPFIQSALRQASVGQQLSASIGAVALQRYNVAEQIKLDEATIEATNALRQLAFDYTKDGNPESVLDGDNPRWFSDVERIKEGLLKKLGKNKTSLQKFNASFNIAESNQRFGLRNAVTSASNTKQQKLINKKLEAMGIELSGPNANIDTYLKAMKKFAAETKGPIELGTLDSEETFTATYEMQKTVAANILKTWGNNDPLKIMNLRAYLSDPNIKDKPEGHEYAEFLLRSLNNNDIMEILETAKRDALDYIDYEQKLVDRIAGVRKDMSTTWSENFFTINEDMTFSMDQFKNLVPGYMDINETNEVLIENAFATKEVISAAEAQHLIAEMINDPFNGMTISQDMKNSMDRAFFDNFESQFVSEQSPQTVKNQANDNYSEASWIISKGDTSLADLRAFLESDDAFPGGFTLNHYNMLKNEVVNSNDRNMKAVISSLKSGYQVMEDGAPNKKFGELLQRSYMEFHSRLMEWKADNPTIIDMESLTAQIAKIKADVGVEQTREFKGRLIQAMKDYNEARYTPKFNIDGTIEEIKKAMNDRFDNAEGAPAQGKVSSQNGDIRGLLTVIEMLGGSW